ncbi:MAG: hypothetical protein ACOC22_01675 [bacterium]
MKTLILNSDTVFVGAKILHKKTEEEYYVYKVNAKSMYIGKQTYLEIKRKWDMRKKGDKWKDFMQKEKASMVKYDDYEITVEEAEKKEVIEEKNEKRDNQKKLLTISGEKRIDQLYRNIFQKGKGNYRFPLEFGTTRVVVIAFSNDEQALLNVGGEKYFFDMKDEIYTRFKHEKHHKNGEIIWPIRETI